MCKMGNLCADWHLCAKPKLPKSLYMDERE